MQAAVWFLLVLQQPAAVAADPRCLLVSSYHAGYAWSDGIERGLRAGLAGRCELQVFHLDSKRRKRESAIRDAAKRARQLIDAVRPDVVITADDNAARYLVMPWYRDHAIPFVFCGVNWTVDEYGFPYSNVTGMVEVAPIDSMFEQAGRLLPEHPQAFYLGAETTTEAKNLKRMQKAARDHGIALSAKLATSLQQWLSGFDQAQRHDLLILGSNAGIPDWSVATAAAHARQAGRRLSATNHGWMMPYAMVGFTKVPEEQGEWAARAALSILGGNSPADIPIVANRRWDLWINPGLLDAAAIQLPQSLRDKAKRVAGSAETTQ